MCFADNSERKKLMITAEEFNQQILSSAKRKSSCFWMRKKVLAEDETDGDRKEVGSNSLPN
jgi:hypothetical protein